MPDTTEIPLDESLTEPVLSPKSTALYAKCLACPDYGTTCRGFDLVTLGDIGTVRAFHRAMKKARNLSLKSIAPAAPTISEYTISEYFSNVAKDYKWTTVVAIDNAMLCICGNRVGLPPIDHSCPAGASEYKNQLSAADLNIAAANLSLAASQAECDELRRKLSDLDGSHLTQIAEIKASTKAEVEWLKQELTLWRRFSFVLLGAGVIVLACLLLYLGWDIAHGASGLIRY